MRGKFDRKTKIVCTIGPSSASMAVLRKMALAGMDIARLNFAHGAPAFHSAVARRIKKVSGEVGRPIGILADLPGPKVRLGRLSKESVRLCEGQEFRLTTRKVMGDERIAPVDRPSLASEVKRGHLVYLADGTVKLQVAAVAGKDIVCNVLVGGEIRSGKGVNIPTSTARMRPIAGEGIRHLKFASRLGVDFLGLSFVTDARGVRHARKLVRESGRDMELISKIERREALQNIGSIVEASDAIMVARGDLGVELEIEKVPLAQKEIIRVCNLRGKPVITATQMLESMVSSPNPTRAEIADIANAVIDGTDAVMLSEETAVGAYPIEAVRVMASVARETEKQLPYESIIHARRPALQKVTGDVLSYAACESALEIKASIIAPTRSGTTARRLSKYRPPTPIIALTPDRSVYTRLTINWGVFPFLVSRWTHLRDAFEMAERFAAKSKLVRPGEQLAILAGDPLDPPGLTNVLKLTTMYRKE